MALHALKVLMGERRLLGAGAGLALPTAWRLLPPLLLLLLQLRLPATSAADAVNEGELVLTFPPTCVAKYSG